MAKINPFTAFDNSNADLDSIKKDIKLKNGVQMGNPSATTPPPMPERMDFRSIFDKKNKEEISLFNQDIDQRDVYAQVGDDLIAKYPEYYKGVDNNELYAQNQSWQEKWIHGTNKMVQKIGTSVLGGVVGSVTGIFEAMNEGSLSAIYDNDFNRMLDEYNEKLDYKLPNYYTEEERDMGFVESMGTANFWANDLTGGLSFTIGTVISEGIWGLATGGTSLIAKGALGNIGRWSTRMLGKNKALKGLADWKAPTKNVINKSTTSNFDEAVEAFTKNAPKRLEGRPAPLRLGAANAGKASENIRGIGAIDKQAAVLGARIPKALNQARFIYTSAGYEAGVEARHYLKEMEDEWLMNFQEENGRLPNQDELYEFYKETQDTGNAVWLANLALVGSSNMAIFGKMLLGKSTKPAISNSALRKELFGVGYTTKNGVATAIEASKAQKIAGKTYSILRAPLIEGFYEEGGQSVASKSVKDYILSGFDSESTQDNLGMIDSLIEGFKQTYTTKEGRKEVGLGMIIGLFGGGLATRGRFNEISSERANIEQTTEFRNAFQSKDVLAASITSERMKANNRIAKANQKQTEARENNDLTGEFLSEQQAILASIERDVALQGRKQGIADYEAYLNTVSDAELADQLDIDVSEVSEWKKNKLEQYSTLSERYAENEQYARALVGDKEIAGLKDVAPNASTEQIIKAIAYNLTIGEQSKDFTTKLAEDIKAAIAGEYNLEEELAALDVDQLLSTASKQAVDKYMNLSRRAKNLQEQKNKVETELQSAQYNSNPTNPEAHKSRLDGLQKRIVELDNQLAELSEQKEVAYSALGIQSELITEADLDAQGERINTLKERIKGFETTNPKLFATLDKLFNEYQKSKSNTVSFNNLMKELSDPQIRVSTINGWLSGLVSKGKTLDESTADFFRQQIEQYQKNVVQGVETRDRANDTTQAGETEETTEEVSTETQGDEMLALEERNPVPTPESMVDNLKKRVSEIMGKSIYTTTYIGDSVDEAAKNKPSQEDLDRYEELLGNINSKYITRYRQLINAPKNYFKRNGIDTGLNETELEELRGLQTKLSNWKILQGSVDESNDSISDLLLLIEQLEAQVEKENTKTEVNENEYAEIRQRSETAMTEGNIESAAPVQSPDQVVTKIVRNNETGEEFYTLSHLNVTSLTRLFPNSSLEIVQKEGNKAVSELSDKVLSKRIKKEGQKFVLTTPDGVINITIDQKSRLKINKQELDAIIENSNIEFTNYGSGNFLDVYENLDNGESVPLRGDFNFESTDQNEILEINPNVVNNLSEGDVLITRINKNDAFNNNLLETYNRSKKTEADKTELMNNLHIYVTDQRGQLVGSLRAWSNDFNNSTATKNLLEMRRKAVDMFLEEGNTGTFGLNEAMPIQTIFVGSPNLTIRRTEDGLKPQAIDFTDSALDKVEDVGFLEGETLRLRNLDADNVIKTFLPRNSAQKLPVTILKINGKSVAFPVSLKSASVSRLTEFEGILNTQLSDTAKMTKINELLIENGLRPSNFTNESQSGLDMNLVREALGNIQEFPNVVDWLDSSYNLRNLQDEAQIAVDLDNKPFNLSKVILDLDKVRTVGSQEQAQWKFDNLEEQEFKILNNLQGYARRINMEQNDYASGGDNNFTQYMAENPFEFNMMWSDQAGNVNKLKDLLKIGVPQSVSQAHPEGFFDELRELIAAYDKVRADKKEANSIKNGKTKNEANQQKTDCP